MARVMVSKIGGLGLALVRQIARRHGGDAQCVDGGDGHSCFVVRLPSLP